MDDRKCKRTNMSVPGSEENGAPVNGFAGSSVVSASMTALPVPSWPVIMRRTVGRVGDILDPSEIGA